MKKMIKRIIPKSWKPKARKIYHLLIKPFVSILRRVFHFIPDRIELLLGKRDRLIPPKWMLYVGPGDFKAIGEKLLGHFIEPGGLKPGDTVLDVGCGIGRIAVPLTGYLKDGGSYEGIDIVADGIRWCKKNITPLFPNFHFYLANIYNETYNPKGKYKASEYKFPYEDETFDFVFLTSVFNHMLRQDIENYLSEISRVLKKGGRCLTTLFLLNKESLHLIDLKQSDFDFQYPFEGYRVNDKEKPGDAIAYDEAYIRQLYKNNNLEILEPIHYGSWCGRETCLCYLDYVFAFKKN